TYLSSPLFESRFIGAGLIRLWVGYTHHLLSVKQIARAFAKSIKYLGNPLARALEGSKAARAPFVSRRQRRLVVHLTGTAQRLFQPAGTPREWGASIRFLGWERPQVGLPPRTTATRT